MKENKEKTPAILLFERLEKKYIINKKQFDSIMEVFTDKMKEGAYGKYTICNIYFDDDTFEQIRLSLLKPSYKQKLRLRSYGQVTDDDMVYFEIKKKYKGVVYKRRIKITYRQYLDYIEKGIKPVDNESFREIDYIKKHFNLVPKCFLAYDRREFVCKEDKTLRVTFDDNIRSRYDKLDLREKIDGTLSKFDGDYIMEVKANQIMPFWLCRLLNDLKIYPASYSKYGQSYLDKFINEEDKK